MRRATCAARRRSDRRLHDSCRRARSARNFLSQLGAECIKIESKTRPDAFRKPHAVYGRMTAATFDQVSVNKLSVRLNLKRPEAVVLAKRLVAHLGCRR